MTNQDWDEYYSDEGHQADLRAERRAQLEADGPYDDYEFAEDLQEFWEDEE